MPNYCSFDHIEKSIEKGHISSICKCDNKIGMIHLILPTASDMGLGWNKLSWGMWICHQLVLKKDHDNIYIFLLLLVEHLNWKKRREIWLRLFFNN